MGSPAVNSSSHLWGRPHFFVRRYSAALDSTCCSLWQRKQCCPGAKSDLSAFVIQHGNSFQVWVYLWQQGILWTWQSVPEDHYRCVATLSCRMLCGIIAHQRPCFMSLQFWWRSPDMIWLDFYLNIPLEPPQTNFPWRYLILWKKSEHSFMRAWKEAEKSAAFHLALRP